MAGDHGGIRGKGPMAYEGNSHVPLIVVHPDYPRGQSSAVLTSHLDLMPSLPGLARVPEAQRREAVKGLPGHDFSGVLATAETASPQAVRPGVLFNYVAPLTIDADYCVAGMKELLQNKVTPPLTELKPKLGKRGFLSFVFDGRYKFVRYYAPANFNTPGTLDQIMHDNDVQLFDLKTTRSRTHNLAARSGEEQGSHPAHERLAERADREGSGQERWQFPPRRDQTQAVSVDARCLIGERGGSGVASPIAGFRGMARTAGREKRVAARIGCARRARAQGGVAGISAITRR